jgi:hypothetical protein
MNTDWERSHELARQGDFLILGCERREVLCLAPNNTLSHIFRGVRNLCISICQWLEVRMQSQSLTLCGGYGYTRI